MIFELQIDFTPRKTKTTTRTTTTKNAPYLSLTVNLMHVPKPKSKRQDMRMTYDHHLLAKACDSTTGVSDRATSIIASFVLEDMGMVSPNDISKDISVRNLR